MSKVLIKIPPFLASMLTARSSDWLIIDNEIEEGDTIGELLVDLASSYTAFRKALFNPDVGEVSDQVLVVLNDTLLQGPNIANTKLNDGDSVTLFTVYSGG